MKISSLPSTLLDSNAVQAVIEGDLVIRNSTEIKNSLLDLLENYQNIEIQFKNIDKIDFSALQLFVALHKSALAQQKTVKYSFENSEYIQDVLYNSGYYKFFSANFPNA